MKKVPIWVRLKASFLGRGIIIVEKSEEKDGWTFKWREYRTIERQNKELAWGHPRQVYKDDKGNFYTNDYYIGHAIIDKVGWGKFPKTSRSMIK